MPPSFEMEMKMGLNRYASLVAFTLFAPTALLAGDHGLAAATSCQNSSESGAFTLAPQSLDDVRDGLSVTSDTVNIVRNDVASGACASGLYAFVMGNFFFTNGTSLSQDSSNGHFIQRTAFTLGDRVIDERAAHPEIPGGQFKMAYRSGFRRNGGELTTYYVGLWQEAGHTTVRYFSQLPSGKFTEPKAILSSALPIRSVTYFPAPDSPSGRLGLVQEAAGKVRLISIDWSHRGIFG